MQTVDHYIKAFGRTPKEMFLAEIPCPLLVCRDQVSQAETDKSFRTITMTPKEVQRAAAGTATALVLRIVKRPDSPFPNWISIGRTKTTDLTIEHSQISKFHAYFTFNEASGLWSVTDAGSTNGTAVESTRLNAKEPAPLKDGSRINFGKLEVVFRLPASFHDELAALSD